MEGLAHSSDFSAAFSHLEMHRGLVRPEGAHVDEGLVALVALEVHPLLVLGAHVVREVRAHVRREVAVLALVRLHPLVDDLWEKFRQQKEKEPSRIANACLHVDLEGALLGAPVLAQLAGKVLDLVVHRVDVLLQPEMGENVSVAAGTRGPRGLPDMMSASVGVMGIAEVVREVA